MIDKYVLVIRRDGKNNIEHEIPNDFAEQIIESGAGKIVNGKLVGDCVNIMHIEIAIKE